MRALRRPSAVAATRLSVLDGLRGCGVLLVVLLHFRSFDTGSTPFEHLYLYLGDAALIALDMFFVLSGFLITGILLDSKGSFSYYLGFYGRRFLRIVPLYYGFLFAYFILLPRITHTLAVAIDLTARQQSWYWLYLANVAAAFSNWGWRLSETSWSPETFGVAHLWSLSVEEQFYLVWPVIVSVSSSAALRRVCLACLIASPLFRVLLVGVGGEGAHFAAHVLTPGRLEALALGALMALQRREQGGLAGFEPWARRVGAGAAITVLGVFAASKHLTAMTLPLVTLGLTASAYAGAAIVLLSLQGSERTLWHRSMLSWPMQQLGQYSYAIYVLHNPIWYLFEQSDRLTRARVGAWIPNRLGGDLVYSAVIASITIMTAAISWHTYEKHFLALRRYLPYRFEQPVSARSVIRVSAGATSTTPGAW